MKDSVFDRWDREARTVINKICGIHNLWHLKEEMLGESYVTLAKLLKNGKDVESMPVPVIRAVIKRSVVSFLRSWFGKNKQKSAAYLEEMFLDSRGNSRWEKNIRNGKCPEEKFLSKELEEKLYTALKKLPNKERFVIEKLYLEEVKGKEVAKLLGVTSSAVTHYKNRAIKRLKTILARELSLEAE